MSDGPEETDGPRDEPNRSEPSPKPRPAGPDTTAGWYAIAGIGLEFVTAVGVFLLIGWWLDRKWNSFPWLTITGAAAGFAVGLYLLVKAAGNAFKE